QSGYHAATSDHPFLDMSRGVEARVEDARLMSGYAAAGDYPPVALEMVHASEVDIEDAADLTLDELRTSDVHRLSATISGTFGIRRHQPAYHDELTGYHQVELVRKSIPSGGSRHPTEFFLEVLRSPFLQAGVWHYNAKRRQLHLVDEEVDEVVHSDAD
ncbi:nitroreductase family protein, partial [Clavibacter michiganensis]|uniref:hypothetical protein n=1 Tax=Clavibacter michiganensis TaxID=28447 RepID=UPI00292DE13C